MMLSLITYAFLSIEFFSSTAFAISSNNNTDQQALLQFKSKITNDPFGVLSSWNSTIHFCQWYGVRCGSKHQKVTVLDLRSLKLEGPVSPQLGNLSFLRELNLQNNSFNGEIPPQMGHLRRLRWLNLNNNSLSGQIPANLSSCSNLVAIDLSYNQIGGNIPQELGTLSNLQSFFLISNNLSGTIPQFLGNFSNLERLSLTLNQFVGSIPDALGRLQNIRYLSFAANMLSGSIPPSIFNLSSLTDLLNFGGNHLEGDLSSVSFTSLAKIIFFSVADNWLTGTIPASVSNMSKVDNLQFALNSLTGNVLSLENLKKIRILRIQRNYLGSGQANDLEFLASLTNASLLEILDLGRNKFGGSLPQQIANLSVNLRDLTFESNRIQGSIPSAITNLLNLTLLYAHGNQFSGMIPSTIGRLQKLVFLSLSNNMFSGDIPSSIGNLTRLIDLRLDGNRFQGNIPSSLGKCENLLALDLSRNNLTGGIPPQVIGLASISIGIDLSENNLTGVVPMEIGNLKNTGMLDLSWNMLSGEIPSTLGSCVMLEAMDLGVGVQLILAEGDCCGPSPIGLTWVIDSWDKIVCCAKLIVDWKLTPTLGSNFFEGSILSSLRSLRGLEYLDLSHNNFSGEIPVFLSTFVALQYLNLSFNSFVGIVPVDGVFKNVSATPIQGNSKLCGGLPELLLPKCSSEMPKMKGLGKTLRLVIGIGSGLLGVILMLSIMFSFWLRSKRKEPELDYPANAFLELSYKNLYEASDRFSPANVIGTGSFGCVYKGRLDGEGTLIAIKVLKLVHHRALKSFTAECEILKKVRHRNLVKVLTACSSIDHHGTDFKALVYEFMVNGSLDEWLHQADAVNESVNALRKLSLLQRLNVAIDVACALDYIHHQCETPIVHCDLKPSNILFDEEMTAHVGDFGLARFLLEAHNDSNGNQSSSIGVRGTVGYAPPEYGMGNEVSTSGDVYSYGIVLLEMFTGKRPVDEVFNEDLNLHNFVGSVLPEQVREVLDPVLVQEIELQETNSIFGPNQRTEELLVSIFRIGVSCSVESAGERVRMDDVAARLISIRSNHLGNGRRES